ncbi:MAG: aquaporin [Anaerolineae bacterium]|jgi:aquaporin Z|nr:aquaporin [Anaerolineae bacterium]
MARRRNDPNTVNTVPALIAEFLGTFTLVFVGVCAVTIAGTAGGVAVAALAHGLILIGLIYTFGNFSGAHFNPAVTAGLLVGGRIPLQQAGFYMLVQFLGGIVAAVIASFVLPTGTNLGQTLGSLSPSTQPVQIVIFEAIMTFFLVSTIYQTAVYKKAGDFAPIAIGFTLAGAILAGGVYTGASLNAARTLGPALIAGDLSYLLPYFIGIFAGGILAGLLHSLVLNPE